ncbi:CBS domain protein [Roseovarius litorisediminis]|uniref:CBS domain protein n=1 Tax=Roseovarius litorisediminis TaxID=1312363 RepID=A0A1Y5RHT2_9RHOB|nr:CBS domain-containing protein [Roseovarius litorisediminis]SLN15179.1 CBS domain protein [Roseovarius litorisediminis]
MEETFVRVDTLMRTDLHRIDGFANIHEALAMMRENKVSSLIIDRRHPGDEYGFLTVNEIASRVIAENRSFERTSVYQVMEKPVLTIVPDMNVKYAVRLLTQLGRRRALVHGDTGLLGFVSLRDLVLSYAG